VDASPAHLRRRVVASTHRHIDFDGPFGVQFVYVRVGHLFHTSGHDQLDVRIAGRFVTPAAVTNSAEPVGFTQAA
jgi:hypothetical protein